MGAEFLLYGYGLVCVSMLVFNLLYSFYLRAGDRRLTKREDRLRQRVEEQLEQLRQLPPGAPQEIQASHLTWMRRRLSHVNNLLAFDQLLAAWAAGDAACQAYLSQLQPVFFVPGHGPTSSGRAPRPPTTATSWRRTSCAATWRWTPSSR